MKHSSFDAKRTAWALAALTGLTLAACNDKDAPKEGSAADSAEGADKNCCHGKNECKGKGRCAVPGKNDCAGKNECKGKGGCNMHCPE